MSALLQVEGLAKRYGDVPVFDRVSLSVAPGEFVAIIGESGVGKSTLLNAIAGLDTVDAGHVLLDGQDVATLDDTQHALLRRRHLGFVFQAFHVLPHLSVAQNVALPLLLLGRHDDARVDEVLAAVGLQGLGERLPQQLSGGQLQRVAIARALVHAPRLVLADEPTGNLDPDLSLEIMNLFREINARGTTVVVATHDRELIRRVGRRAVTLDHGRVVEVIA